MGITAPLFEGQDTISRATEELLKKIPDAQPCTTLQAVLLSQVEVWRTQRAINSEGLRCTQKIQHGVYNALRKLNNLPVGQTALRGILIIPDPTHIESERRFAAYRLKSPGAQDRSAQVRHTLRETLLSVARQAGVNSNIMDGEYPYLPIAELPTHTTTLHQASDLSGTCLGLPNVAFGPLELHRAFDMPQFSPTASESGG
jgi:hypothetical protein